MNKSNKELLILMLFYFFGAFYIAISMVLHIDKGFMWSYVIPLILFIPIGYTVFLYTVVIHKSYTDFKKSNSLKKEIEILKNIRNKEIIYNLLNNGQT